MTRRVLTGLVACSLVVAARAGAQAAPERAVRRASTRSALAVRLEAILDSTPFDRALWGIAIADPSGRIVFERNGERLFQPASNAKLVVSAVAAALLPPDFRFRTSVYATVPIAADGVLHGDLVLYGRGDPTLSDRYYPTRFGAFESLADQLRARGLSRVEGDLIADASYFDSTAIHPSWEAYDLNWWYGASVTALGFNDNAVDFTISPGVVGAPPIISFQPDLGVVRFTNNARTVGFDQPRTLDFRRRVGTNDVWAEGDVPLDARPWTENFAVHDAPAWTAAAFRHALRSQGITVTGAVRVVFDPGATTTARQAGPLAEVRSRPLADIIEPILETSHNWYAEMLLKTLGRELGRGGSWEAGLEVERRFLIDSLGVDSTMFRLADASGLSHWNLITPRAFVQLLTAMRDHRRFESFRDALPVGGVRGTLRSRFRGTGLTGRVRAKTGSIANTNTLSGYVETPSGVWTFSIQINNHAAGNREALRRIDDIVATFAR